MRLRIVESNLFFRALHSTTKWEQGKKTLFRPLLGGRKRSNIFLVYFFSSEVRTLLRSKVKTRKEKSQQATNTGERRRSGLRLQPVRCPLLSVFFLQ